MASPPSSLKTSSPLPSAGQQLIKPLVSIDRKHPLILPIIGEHSVWARCPFEQRLNGYGNLRNDSFQLLGDTARVSQVGNYETSHAGKQRDSLGNVPPSWDGKVEQNRYVGALA